MVGHADELAGESKIRLRHAWAPPDFLERPMLNSCSSAQFDKLHAVKYDLPLLEMRRASAPGPRRTARKHLRRRVCPNQLCRRTRPVLHRSVRPTSPPPRSGQIFSRAVSAACHSCLVCFAVGSRNTMLPPGPGREIWACRCLRRAHAKSRRHQSDGDGIRVDLAGRVAEAIENIVFGTLPGLSQPSEAATACPQRRARRHCPN